MSVFCFTRFETGIPSRTGGGGLKGNISKNGTKERESKNRGLVQSVPWN